MDAFYGRKIDYVTAATLIEELLGFDPQALATLAPAGEHKNESALLGLKAFLRRIYEFALVIRDSDSTSLPMLTDADAREHSWPNARIGNLAILFAWSMVREFRWFQALPFLALEPSQSDGAHLPTSDGQFAELSLDALIREVSKSADLKQGERYVERYPISIVAIAEEMLGIKPLHLVARFRENEAHVGENFAAGPDGCTALGLDRTLHDAASQYHVMVARKTDRIRLMSDVDAAAAGRWTARHANLVTLFSAALQRRLAGRSRLVTQQTVGALLHEALLPAPHGGLGDARLAHDGVGAETSRCQKHDAAAPNVVLRAPAISDDRLHSSMIHSTDGETDPCKHPADSHSCEMIGIPDGTLANEFIH